MFAASTSTQGVRGLHGLAKVASHSARLLQQVVTTTSAMSTLGQSCGWNGQAMVSRYSATIPDVKDLTTCQQYCQVYSDPLYIAGCVAESPLSPPKSICVAVNYSKVDGRCTLLADVIAVVAANDFDSAPVACKDQDAFVTEQSYLDQLKTNSTSWTCLQNQQLVPTAPKFSKPQLATWSSHTFDFRETLRSDVNDILKAYSELPAVVETAGADAFDENESMLGSDSESTAAATEEALSSPVARRLGSNSLNPLDNMPRITADMANVTEGWFYQTANVLSEPSSTLGSVPMSFPRGVEDWRECALLCDLAKPDCQAWSFLYTPSWTSGGCYLATNDNYPTVLNPDGDLKAISGLVFDKLPSYLFGEQVQDSDATNTSLTTTFTPLQSLHPECHSVSYLGYLFRTSADIQSTLLPTNLYSIGATSVDYCAQACSGTQSCIAFQFIPKNLSDSSTRLKSIVDEAGANCALFTGLGSSPVLHASDPLVGAGFLSCGTTDKSSDRSPIAQWMTVNESQIPETRLTTDLSYVSEHKHSCASTSPWSVGWSIKGTLLTGQANLIRNVQSSVECDDYCRNVQDCEGWTYGAWQSCYLFYTVEGYVEDAECTSGQLKCARRLSATTTAAVTANTTAPLSNIRTIDNCDRSKKNAYYRDGSVLDVRDHENMTADNCFRLCRETPQCNYMSWLNKGVVLEGKTFSQPQCVLLEDVKESDLPLPLHGGVISEMICDAAGRALSRENIANLGTSVSVETPLWIALGGVGGASIVIAGLIGYVRYRKPVTYDSPEAVNMQDSFNMSRLILNTTSFHNQLSDRLSFQSEINCEVDERPVVASSKQLVRFSEDAAESPPLLGERGQIDPGTCITMRTEESNNSPGPCLDDFIRPQVDHFEPHTTKSLRGPGEI